MVGQSQNEVSDTVQFRVCVPHGAGSICFIGACFSVAGNTVTNKRNILSAENVHNVVFLHGCHGFRWNSENNDAVGEMGKQEMVSRPMKAQKLRKILSRGEPRGK